MHLQDLGPRPSVPRDVNMKALAATQAASYMPSKSAATMASEHEAAATAHRLAAVEGIEAWRDLHEQHALVHEGAAVAMWDLARQATDGR
jgi:hypothetical protein